MGTIVFIIILWLLFCIVGLLTVPEIFCDENIYLKIGSAYFVGNLLIISLIRLLSFLFKNFVIGIIVTFILAIIYIFLFRNKLKKLLCTNYKQLANVYFKVISLSLLICVLLSLCCVYGTPDNYDVYSHLGTAHSGRYVNLAYDIVLNNRIPIVGQNYGQSILVAIGLLLGQIRPYFQLNLWVDITISTFVLFTYGLICCWGTTKKYSQIASIIIVCANTALSLNYIHIVDTGSPIIRSGYVDSHLSIASCIIVLLYFSKYLVNLSCSQITYFDYLFLFAMGIGWNIVGAYIGCIIGVFLLILLCFNIFLLKIKNLNHLIVCLGVFFYIGTLMGGVLTVSTRYDSLCFEGMLTAQGPERQLRIMPYLQYELGLNGISWANKTSICGYIEPITMHSDRFVWWYSIEQSFFEAIRLTFWPIAGSVSYLMVYIKKRKNMSTIKLVDIFGLNSIFLLLIGLGVAYGIEFGSKWWLTRFAAPGYYMGLLCLVIVLFELYKKRPRLYGFYIGIIFLVMTIGPITNMLISAKNQIISNGGIFEYCKIIKTIYNFPPNIFY